MTVDYGIDGEELEQIRKRDQDCDDDGCTVLLARGALSSPQYDRRTLLNMVDHLLRTVDDQAAALCLLQDGIGDIRTEIIKDM